MALDTTTQMRVIIIPGNEMQQERRMLKLEDRIELDGETWRIVGLGVEQDGYRFVHLSSTTRFRQQRNGANPVQIMTWIKED